MTSPRDPRFAELDAWIERRLAHDALPGVSVAITTREETIYVGSHGIADVAGKTPLKPHHAFEIGSIGKSFTALLLLRMQERGQIDLQRPVSDYLPWFAVKSEYEQIRVHHLLTHTAGIMEGSDMADDGRFEAWYLREQEVSGPPGANFHYSNVGYKTLGYVIENVLGKNYGEAVTEEILTPLGMRDSFVPITNGHRLRLATPHRWLYDDRPHRWSDPLVPDTWIETGTADGGIACTPADFAIYAREVMNHASSLVSEVSFSNLIADFSNTGTVDPDATYGYGFATFKENGRLLWGHGGGMPGHFAFLVIDPDAGIAACGAVNGPGSANPYVYAALAYARSLLAGETPTLPEIKSRSSIENAADYVGEYANENVTCRLRSTGGQLVLEWEGEHVALEQRSRDRFWADSPSLALGWIGAERIDGQVVAINHGPYWLGRTDIAHDTPASSPDEWNAYAGWFRCHNPWKGLIRIFLRRGKLILDFLDSHESELIPLENRCFQIGESPSPERIAFDAIADGVALRAIMNGQPYYRTPESSVESGRFARRP